MEDICNLGLYQIWCGRGLGGQVQLLQKWTFGLSARTKLLRHSSCTYKTFVSDRFSRLFIFTSKNASVNIGLAPRPPPLAFLTGLSWHVILTKWYFLSKIAKITNIEIVWSVTFQCNMTLKLSYILKSECDFFSEQESVSRCSF